MSNCPGSLHHTWSAMTFARVGRQVFDSTTKLHALAGRDNTIYRVELTITQKP